MPMRNKTLTIAVAALLLGGSVQEACAAIDQHWAAHAAEMRAAPAEGKPAAPLPAPAATPDPPVVKAATGKLRLGKEFYASGVALLGSDKWPRHGITAFEPQRR